MTEEEPFVSICVPLYERDEWFDKLIESIKSHDAGIPYEICIGEGHNAASVNRNKAMRQAKSNYILQLDGDAEIIQDNWLKNMYETLKSDSKIAIVGCILEFPTGKVDHPGTILVTDDELKNNKIDYFFKASQDFIREFLKWRVTANNQVIPYEINKEKIDGKIYSVNQCSGACFLFDRRKTGEFLEIYRKAGWEDVDLMARVRAIGYLIFVDGRVRIKHPNHVRTKEEQAMRDSLDSERGFNPVNFTEYAIRWGSM